MELVSKCTRCSVSMFIALCTIVTFKEITGAEANIEYYKDDSSIINSTVVNILMKHFPTNGRTTMIVYGSPPNDLCRVLVSMKLKLVIMSVGGRTDSFDIEVPGDLSENYILHRIGIVLFFANTEEIAQGLVRIAQSIYWSSDVKVIVHSEEKLEEGKLFYLFWWYKILNCIILDFDENNNDVIVKEYTPFVMKRDSDYNQYQCWSKKAPDEMYEGNMYDEVICNQSCSPQGGQSLDDLAVFLTCIQVDSKKINTAVNDLFEDKSGNLKGYKLGVFAVNVPPMCIVDQEEEGLKMFKGKDGKILNILAEKMNFSVRYEIDKSMKKEASPTFTAYVQGLMNLAFRRADVAANTMYLIPVPFPPLDLAYPIEGSGLCFLVQRAKQLPAWINLLHIFDMNSLIAMVTMFILIVIFYFVNIKRTHKSVFDSIGLSYLYTISFFLSMPVSVIKGNNLVRLIIFISFWIIFVVNFMFQGLIVSYLTVPRYDKEVDTFEDLVATGFDLEGYPSPDAILPPTSEIFITLNKRFKQRVDLFGCATELVKANDKACWLDCLTAIHLVKTLKDENDNLAVHIGRDRIHSDYLSYPMTRDSPFRLRVEHYITKILESGLLGKMHKDALTPAKAETTETKVLKINDLEGCFYSLMFVHCISLTFFLLELLVSINYRKLLHKIAIGIYIFFKTYVFRCRIKKSKK